MISVQAMVRTARIFHALLLVSMLVFAFVGEKAGPAEPREPEPSILPQAFALVSVLILGMAFFVRARMMRPAEEALRQRADDGQALMRWWRGNIFSFVMCEAVALYGFALRMLGGTLVGSAPFYAGAILLMLVWTPCLDPSG